MAQSLKEIVTQLFNDTKPVAVNLYSRWLDERQYEDINDYAAPLRPIVEATGGKIAKMTKRPFGFIVAFPLPTGVVKVHFTVNQRFYAWKKVS